MYLDIYAVIFICTFCRYCKIVQELSAVRRILSACEKIPRKSMIIWPQFLQNGFILEMCFVLLTSVAERSEFVSDYSLQLTTAICLYTSMGKYVLATLGLSLWLYNLLIWLLLTFRVWCLMFWITLAMAWGFSSMPYLLAQFSQVVPPLE